MAGTGIHQLLEECGLIVFQGIGELSEGDLIPVDRESGPVRVQTRGVAFRTGDLSIIPRCLEGEMGEVANYPPASLQFRFGR
jgi:hypothetical protein